MRRQWLPPALVCFAVLLAIPVSAFDAPAKPADYIAAHWDTEDGLPHNFVRSIYQTREGYLWIGTEQGVARFDGLKFTIFNQHNTPAILNNLITSFAETADGSLWMGTSFGLVRYHDGQFSSYGRTNGLKADTVNGLCVAPDGSLWIGGREGITRWVDGKFVNDIDTSAYDTLGLRFLSVDRHRGIWLAAGSDALCYRDGKFTHYGRAEGLPARSLRMVCEDTDGSMVAVTFSGLFRLQDGHFIPFEHNSALSSRRAVVALADHRSNLWIGSAEGLDLYRDHKVTPYTTPAGDKLTGIETLFEDREHCLWVGNSAGLYRLTDRRASLLPLEGGTTEGMTSTLMLSRNGSLWIGKWNNGVDRVLNGVTTHYQAGAPLSPEPVTVIYESRDGTTWLGNRGSSIDRLEGDKLTRFVYQSGVLSSRPVTAMFQDTNSDFFVGISRRGLLQLRDEKLIPVPEAAELSNDTVWTITRTSDGRLLLGTDKGLYQRTTDRSWKRVALTGRRYVVGARAMLEANDGAIWIATEGDGLVRWQNGKERVYTSREGMVDDVLFSVLDDNHGSLWVNSARGIARIRKTEFEKVDRGEAVSLNCLTFGRADGLLSASTSGNGSPSLLCLPDDNILAATDQGVAVINQERIQINPQPPPVIIENVVVDERSLSRAREVSVPAGAYRIEIHYSALSLVAPEKLRFRYLLEGSDPGWIEAGYHRIANYTHLSPGRYTFRVLACNNDGIWNEHGDSLVLQIQPHFYQTKTFIALVVAFVAGAIFAIYRIRRRSALHRMAVLENLVGKRTRELKIAKEAAEAAVSQKNESIVALKKAEVERERLHQELVEASRQAGMAEVATGVLHNVGNVLNSVNVSSSLLSDLAKKSKVTFVGRVAALLNEHTADLSEFLSHDPKGRQLPDYLSKLAIELKQEQAATLQELAGLDKNIGHIKDIVSMQQSYATVAGVTTHVKVNDLLEDALKMNSTGLVRHDVKVIREFDETSPEIIVDRHKVLQILVNLIRNAIHACNDLGGQDKRLTARVVVTEGQLKISVIDNGIGIPQENLKRIFNHGFTTRKDGHGFGLHSSSLAAKQMGGNLSVHSDGPRMGATFTLELPLQPKDKPLPDDQHPVAERNRSLSVSS
jgi:ligand-binding sensor domain-containing protein/signal transduction histidine kinase